MGINPKNAVHLKLVLIQRNTGITAADDGELYCPVITGSRVILTGNFIPGFLSNPGK